MRKIILITPLLTMAFLVGCQAKNRLLSRSQPLLMQQLKKPSWPIHRLGCLTNNSSLNKLKMACLTTSPLQILLK